jgi:ubiquinone/menaquinone biosynthesis C-methylase UbiE
MANLDSEERRKRLPPATLLTAMGVGQGQSLLDIGAGTGYFTFAAAEIVGSRGHVTAVDPNPFMIAELIRKKALAGPVPIAILQSAEYILPVDAHSVDFALIAFVLHEIEDKRRFLRETARTLKPGGRIGIVEWVKKTMDMGPPLEDRMSHEESADLLAKAGFHDVATTHYSQAHYFSVAQKSAGITAAA